MRVSTLLALCMLKQTAALTSVSKKVGHQLFMNATDFPDDMMHCAESPADLTGSADLRPNAYFVMIGPFTKQRTYKKWLYAVLALSNALKNHGSLADLVVLCAQKSAGAVHLLPEEELLFSRNGIHWRYVSAPYGNSGFHMGHFKMWAWQHVEYSRIQLFDADILPLVNMDRFFSLGKSLDSDFVGCPGKLSVLNAGWFLLRPSCMHFEAMTQILKNDSASWDKKLGWGHELPFWTSSEGTRMKTGWDFFDAHGNQGHMFSYFLFEAKDLTLIYKDKVWSYTGGSLESGEDVLEEIEKHDTTVAKALKEEVFGAYPCPFPLSVKQRAYIHFTGNLKPWTKFNPTEPKFKLWYDALSLSPDVNLQRDVFPEIKSGR